MASRSFPVIPFWSTFLLYCWTVLSCPWLQFMLAWMSLDHILFMFRTLKSLQIFNFPDTLATSCLALMWSLTSGCDRGSWRWTFPPPCTRPHPWTTLSRDHSLLISSTWWHSMFLTSWVNNSRCVQATICRLSNPRLPYYDLRRWPADRGNYHVLTSIYYHYQL